MTSLLKPLKDVEWDRFFLACLMAICAIIVVGMCVTILVIAPLAFLLSVGAIVVVMIIGIPIYLYLKRIDF